MPSLSAAASSSPALAGSRTATVDGPLAEVAQRAERGARGRAAAEDQRRADRSAGRRPVTGTDGVLGQRADHAGDVGVVAEPLSGGEQHGVRAAHRR